MLLLLTGCFLGGAIRFYSGLKEIEGQNGFYHTEEMRTRQQLQNFEKEASEETKRSIEEIVFFRQEENASVENMGLNRTREMILIEAAGNMNLIVPDSSLTAGNFVSNSDTSGCVLSEAASEVLFGSREAIGETVRINQKSYHVRGVVDQDELFCMIQGEEDRLYSCVRVKARGVPLSVLKQMLGGMVNAESSWIFEGDFYIGIGRILFFLPLWYVFIKGVVLFKRKYKKTGKAGRILFPVVIFGGVCILILISVRFSDDYVPAAWSDFEFWTQLLKEKLDMFLMLIQKPLQMADARMIGNLAGVAVCSSGVLLMIGSLVGGVFRLIKVK